MILRAWLLALAVSAIIVLVCWSFVWSLPYLGP